MQTFPEVSPWFCIVVDKKLAAKNEFRLYEVRPEMKIVAKFAEYKRL